MGYQKVNIRKSQRENENGLVLNPEFSFFSGYLFHNSHTSKNRMVKPLFSFPCGFLFVFFGEIRAKSPYFYLHASHMSVSRKHSASAVLQVFVELVNALFLVHRVQVRIYLERGRHVSVPHLRASLHHIYTGQIMYYEHRPRPKKPLIVIHDINELPVICNTAESGLAAPGVPGSNRTHEKNGVLPGFKQGQSVVFPPWRSQSLH